MLVNFVPMCASCWEALFLLQEECSSPSSVRFVRIYQGKKCEERAGN